MSSADRRDGYSPPGRHHKDNGSIKVNAVVYFRVVQPAKAIVEVENFLFATSQLSQTTLRSILANRPWTSSLPSGTRSTRNFRRSSTSTPNPGDIKISNVEVKQIDLPVEMQRAMARQAEAERERRAKVIHAEGEFQASVKLAEAAKVIEKHPTALQLRFLQP